MNRISLSERAILVLYGLTAVLILLVLFMSYFAGSSTNTHILDKEPVLFNDGWSLYREGEVLSETVIPLKDKRFEDSPITIGRRLTGDDCTNGEWLMFVTFHSSVQISIDGRVCYEYGNMESKVFNVPPTAYHFFRLEKQYEGRVLTITTDSPLKKYRGRVNDIYIGDRGSEYIMLVRKNIVTLAVCALLLSLAAIFLSMWILLEFRIKKKKRNYKFLWLAAIAALIAVWSLSETRVLQLVFNNIEPLSVYNFEWLVLIQMAIVGYFLGNSSRYVEKINMMIAPVPVINALLINAMMFMGIADLDTTVIVSHFCIIIVSAFEIFAAIKSRKIEQNRNTGMIISFSGDSVGFFLLVFTVLVDMVRYYVGMNVDNAMFTRIGVMFFIAALGFSELRSNIDLKLVQKQSQTYKQMALHDGLTNLSNRTAYQEKIAYLNASDTGRVKTIVAIFDVNNLKSVNDRQGHEAGDRYIKSCAYFINGFFRDFATLFRIGGDEFAIICSLDDKKRFFAAYDEMQLKYTLADRENINFAYGYAEFDESQDQDLYDTVRRADKMMYECKLRMKKEGQAETR